MASPEALAMLRIARRDLKAAQVLQDNEIDEAIWGFQILDRVHWLQRAEQLVEHVGFVIGADA